MPSRQYTHFNTADYEATGRHFCETLMDFSDPSPLKERLRERILIKLTEGGSNADEPVNVPLTDYSSLSHSESEGSCDEAESETLNKDSIPIKRQLSFRIPKKKAKLPLPIKLDQRPSLSLNKASVEFIRIGGLTHNQKQRKIEDSNSASAADFSLNKELALFKRLTKFRRKPRRPDGIISVAEKDGNVGGYVQAPKYTSILFDDPFNPPGTFPKRRIQSGVDEAMDDDGCDHSGTEDECDEWDAAIKNQKYAQNYEINPEVLPNATSDTSVELLNEFAMLHISPQSKKLPSDTAIVPSHLALDNKPTTTTFAPFAPKLPQGKPLRSFYSMDFEDKFAKEFSEKLGNLQLSNPLQPTRTRRASLATSTSTSLITTGCDRRVFQVGRSHHNNNNRKTTTTSEWNQKPNKSISHNQRRVSWTEIGDRERDKKSGNSSVGFSNHAGPSISGNSKPFKKSKSLTLSDKNDKGTRTTAANTTTITTSTMLENTSVHLSRSQSVRQYNLQQESEIQVLSKKKKSKLKRSKSKKVGTYP